MYGTGWMSSPFNGGKYGPQGYNNEMYPPNNPPAYQQPVYTGTTFNPNDGYYGGHQQGVQYPQNTYQRDQVYEPPAGPPPGK
jgi:Chitin synthesis regulation, resistance to Congo red